VAIVGPSGCGKSTVFRLLYRFYTPSSGQILIDGQPVDDLTLESVRKAIGVVPQDTPLFHADVMHNVRYGKLDATDEAVISATKRARVHDAIMRLPDGYATTVGERGLMISGGEKQRLAVARVLLKDPPILFFDEAVSFLSFLTLQLCLTASQTSALDAHTESELMDNINSQLKGQARTSVLSPTDLRLWWKPVCLISLRAEGEVVLSSSYLRFNPRLQRWRRRRAGNPRRTTSVWGIVLQHVGATII
jgi:ATP-binding cassette subfamily B (MDR/TAP) protein 7